MVSFEREKPFFLVIQAKLNYSFGHFVLSCFQPDNLKSLGSVCFPQLSLVVSCPQVHAVCVAIAVGWGRFLTWKCGFFNAGMHQDASHPASCALFPF